MDLIDTLKNLSNKIVKQRDLIQTEESTKNAFVLPFISALGYDVFDPSEVVPEFTSDIGTKKGEKVDYAIIKDGIPLMFFECKKCGRELDRDHASQLYRYFATNNKTRIGILTNGIVYQFYADLEQTNIMDNKPFLEFNMLEIQEPLVIELKKLSKSTFNIDDILSAASDLNYMKETKIILNEMLTLPSEDFVKFFLPYLYNGVKTQKVIQQFTDIVKRSFNQFINDKINERLKSAMTGDETIFTDKPETVITPTENQDSKSQVETTQEEIESLYIIKSFAREVFDISRISLKDFKTACNIVVDSSVQKTICKLYYNSPKKSISIFDENKKENEYRIENINDIYKYAEEIKASLSIYIKIKE